MALYPRLTGIGLVDRTQKLHVHSFMAAVGEVERGKMTEAQVATAFGLTPAEQTELTALTARIVQPLESISLGGFTTLTNVGTAYDGTDASRGLGFFRVQTAGITGFEFAVGMDRNGAAGTISWQLWDDTNSVEVARIDDTTGAGAKYVNTVVTLGSPLPASLRRIRVRCKSTTNPDDPIYLGANVVIRRVEKLTAVELHEVLMLGEDEVAPYNTLTAITSRLGV